MKSLILKNWPAKIASLALASVLWFLIKKNIEVAAPDLDARQAPLVVTPTDASHNTR